MNVFKIFDVIYLPMSLLAIIGLILLPLSPYSIDKLILINFIGIIAFAFAALYAPRKAILTLFPQLLAIIALCRLGLNIIFMREILLHANAGELINNIRYFISGEHFFVGCFIFLILAVMILFIQMNMASRIVHFSITSKHISEWSLDHGLSYKQSQFYSAMVKAMRFVKFEAIASILLTLLTFLGGYMIGKTFIGMNDLDAILAFGMLIMGAGFIYQLPVFLLLASTKMLFDRAKQEQSFIKKTGVLTAGILMIGAYPILILYLIFGLEYLFIYVTGDPILH